MAKRRKKTGRSRTYRRGRMGAVSGGIMDAVSVIAGGALGLLAAQAVKKLIPESMEEKTRNLISSAAPAVIGYLLPRFVKSPLVVKASYGMYGASGLLLISNTGMLSGIGEVSDLVSYKAPYLAAAYRDIAPDVNYQVPAMAGNGGGSFSQAMRADPLYAAATM